MRTAKEVSPLAGPEGRESSISGFSLGWSARRPRGQGGKTGRAKWPGKEGAGISRCEHEGPADVVFRHGSEDEPKDKGGNWVFQFLEEDADQSEPEHHVDIEDSA